MSRPLVSIVLPVFNRLEYVCVALASVYAQTFENWELIIIDDGSDEETRQFLEKQTDSRTKVLFREHSGVQSLLHPIAERLQQGRSGPLALSTSRREHPELDLRYLHRSTPADPDTMPPGYARDRWRGRRLSSRLGAVMTAGRGVFDDLGKKPR